MSRPSAVRLVSPSPVAVPVSRLDPEVVSACLQRAGLRPAGAPPLQLERGWPMPKIPLMLRYLDPASAGKRRRWWTLHLLADERPPHPYRKALRRGTAVLLEELSGVVQSFPHDPLLGPLQQAASSRTALRTLQQCLGADGYEFDRLSTTIVGYKPLRRCTVRYRLGLDGQRGTTLYGKCLPAEALGPLTSLYRDATRVAAHERWHTLNIAPPAGRIDAWNMLWWKRRPGRSLFELLDSRQLVAASARVGTALAELHASALPWRRTHLPVRELATVRSWIDAVTEMHPQRAAWLERRFLELGLRAMSSELVSLVPAHRDFYDKQILLDGETVTFLDLETAALAEPEIDVANFLTHLELRRLQRPDLDLEQASLAFLESYSSHFRRPRRRRLSWYRACALLRLVCVYSFRLQRAELPSRLQGLVHDGEPSWLNHCN